MKMTRMSTAVLSAFALGIAAQVAAQNVSSDAAPSDQSNASQGQTGRTATPPATDSKASTSTQSPGAASQSQSAGGGDTSTTEPAASQTGADPLKSKEKQAKSAKEPSEQVEAPTPRMDAHGPGARGPREDDESRARAGLPPYRGPVHQPGEATQPQGQWDTTVDDLYDRYPQQQAGRQGRPRWSDQQARRDWRDYDYRYDRGESDYYGDYQAGADRWGRGPMRGAPGPSYRDDWRWDRGGRGDYYSDRGDWRYREGRGMMDPPWDEPDFRGRQYRGDRGDYYAGREDWRYRERWEGEPAWRGDYYSDRDEWRYRDRESMMGRQGQWRGPDYRARQYRDDPDDYYASREQGRDPEGWHPNPRSDYPQEWSRHPADPSMRWR